MPASVSRVTGRTWPGHQMAMNDIGELTPTRPVVVPKVYMPSCMTLSGDSSEEFRVVPTSSHLVRMVRFELSSLKEGDDNCIRPWGEFVRSSCLQVETDTYISPDGLLPLEPLVWPKTIRAWMPSFVSPSSLIPLNDEGARYLETLTRLWLRIVNTQDSLTYAMSEIAKTRLDKDDKQDAQLIRLIRSLAYTNLDACKTAVKMLVAVVGTRRDAFVSSCAIEINQSTKLRHEDFTNNVELFKSDTINSIPFEFQ